MNTLSLKYKLSILHARDSDVNYVKLMSEATGFRSAILAHLSFVLLLENVKDENEYEKL
jgi:hypothetical protein